MRLRRYRTALMLIVLRVTANTWRCDPPPQKKWVTDVRVEHDLKPIVQSPVNPSAWRCRSSLFEQTPLRGLVGPPDDQAQNSVFLPAHRQLYRLSNTAQELGSMQRWGEEGWAGRGRETCNESGCLCFSNRSNSRSCTASCSMGVTSLRHSPSVSEVKPRTRILH